MTERKIYKPKPVSGFPEWLPEERIVEQRWFDSIRRVFESYGYCSIETPSVEEIDVLTAKGEVDKEIYVIERLHKDEKDKNEARLALHFDQTVPLARYVAQRFNDLVFPFKRYQMQRVWRGERPHLADQARLELHLRHRPKVAYDLALENWRALREPSDALILAQSALATRDRAAARTVLRVLARQDLKDQRLARLRAQLSILAA